MLFTLIFCFPYPLLSVRCHSRKVSWDFAKDFLRPNPNSFMPLASMVEGRSILFLLYSKCLPNSTNFTYLTFSYFTAFRKIFFHFQNGIPYKSYPFRRIRTMKGFVTDDTRGQRNESISLN